MELLQEKLIRLAKESEKEMREMGFSSEMGHKKRTYGISPKATRRLGVCKQKKHIEISKYVLEVGTDTQIKNVIIHEIIHTFDKTIGHKSLWQSYAREVNRYGKYKITTTEDINEFFKVNGTTEEQAHKLCNHRYEITCLNCGAVYYKSRIQNSTIISYKHNNRIHTSCGGKKFKVADTKENIVLVDNGDE